MIVTCSSCLTKFHLDESKISKKGTKGRCSRCQHIFLIMPAPETHEKVPESLESPSRSLEALIEPQQMKEDISPPLKTEEIEKERKNEGPLSIYEATIMEKAVPVISEMPVGEKRVEVRTFKIDQNSFRIEWNVLN